MEAKVMKSSKYANKDMTSDVPIQRTRTSQPLDWWTVAQRVGFLMAFVYGSKFVGKIIKHRGFSFLASSEYDPGAL
jgi:hypothetical protein